MHMEQESLFVNQTTFEDISHLENPHHCYLEGMARYASQLLAPAYVLPYKQTKNLLLNPFWPFLGHFLCSVVTL